MPVGVGGAPLPPPVTTGTISNNQAPPPFIDQKIFDSASLLNQGDSQSVITDFEIRSRYERDLHRYMLGVTSPNGFNGKSVAFVQLAATTLLWVADWTGCRFLEKPMVPDPNSVNAGWTLLDVWLEPAQVVLAQNGSTPLFRLTGTYVFGHQNPGSNFYDNVNFPVAPWFTNDSIAQLRTINANDLDRTGLLESQTTAVGTGNLGPSVIQTK